MYEGVEFIMFKPIVRLHGFYEETMSCSGHFSSFRPNAMDAINIQTEVQNAVQASQSNLLDSLKTMIDSKLDSFQKEFQNTQMSLSETQLAKIENLDDNFKFKKRGNEEQYKHNEKVFLKMKEADAQLSGENLIQDNITTARTKICEGMQILRDRN